MPEAKRVTDCNQVDIGMRVKTHPEEKNLRGLLINERHLIARREGEGKVTGYVPGHGGDVWWVDHGGGGPSGAYVFTELSIVWEPSKSWPNIGKDSIFYAKFERVRTPGKILMRGPEGTCVINFPAKNPKDVTAEEWRNWEQVNVMCDGQSCMGIWPDPDLIGVHSTDYQVHYDADHMPLFVEAHCYEGDRVFTLDECRKNA